MRRPLWGRISVAILLFLTLSVASLGAQVKVHGYYRKNGTYVAPYERKAPTHHYTSPAPASPHVAPHTGTPRSVSPYATSHEKRSAKAKYDFERGTGHPRGWPGHVVDHVVPLACGGADAPSNMQWQSVEEGKAKDRVERRGCETSHP